MNLRLLIAFSVAIACSSTVPVSLAQSASSASGSEESRSEELVRLRKERAHQVSQQEPVELNRWERTLLRLERGNVGQLFQIRFKDWYPKFGLPRQGSGLGGGLRYFRRGIGSPNLTLESKAVVSTRGYRMADLQFGHFTEIAPILFLAPETFALPFDFLPIEPGQVNRPKSFLYGDLAYSYFPQEDYYGIGRDSRAADRSDFLLESSAFDMIAGREFSRWSAAAVRVGIRRYRVDRGTDERFPDVQDLFTGNDTPGLTRQPDFLRFASAFYLNNTDAPQNPHSGGIIGFFYTRFDDIGGDEYEFNRFSIDARQYVPLGSQQRTLALRVAASTDRTIGAHEVPFYLQNTLGGDQTLRGYRPYRFRGPDLFHMSAEYRWEPAPAVQLALFYDTGKTFQRNDAFDLEGMKKNWGVGIRFKTAQRIILRIEVGRGDEGARLNFRSGAAF